MYQRHHNRESNNKPLSSFVPRSGTCHSHGAAGSVKKVEICSTTNPTTEVSVQKPFSDTHASTVQDGSVVDGSETPEDLLLKNLLRHTAHLVETHRNSTRIIGQTEGELSQNRVMPTPLN